MRNHCFTLYFSTLRLHVRFCHEFYRRATFVQQRPTHEFCFNIRLLYFFSIRNNI